VGEGAGTFVAVQFNVATTKPANRPLPCIELLC
jgi:hypothetical protein